jgi:hypothetical protein
MAVVFYAVKGETSTTRVKQDSVGEQNCIDNGLIKMVSDNNDPTMTAQADGTWAVDVKKVEGYFTKVTTDFLQSVLDKYNEDNGIALKDVARCELYSRKTGYTHKAFCLAIWEWSVEVWEAVRAIPTPPIPTNEEFETVIRGVAITDTTLQTIVTNTVMEF